jgi:hypothetical protein
VSIRERQPVRIAAPPKDPEDQWTRDVTDALNTLPHLSAFSYDTPESLVSAVPGTLGSNIKDGAASMWVKESGDTTTGWASVATSGAYDQISQISQQWILDTAYGGLLFGALSDSSTRLSGIGTGASQWTAWEREHPSHRLTSDVSKGYCTILHPGTYSIEFTSSFTGTANTEFHSHLLRNGEEDFRMGWHRKLGTGGDVGSAAWSGVLALNSGDTITPSIEVNTGSGNFIGVVNASFVVSLLRSG